MSSSTIDTQQVTVIFRKVGKYLISWLSPSGLRQCARFVVSGVALFLTGVAFYKLDYYCMATRPLNLDLHGTDPIDALYYSEAVKTGVAQKIEGARWAFLVFMAVMGVLWGLVIAKREERVFLLNDWQELISFTGANVLFLISAAFYITYTNFMADVLTAGATHYEDAKDITIMNYLDHRIELVYQWEMRTGLCCVVVAALTLFSSHLLKPQPGIATAPAVASTPAITPAAVSTVASAVVSTTTPEKEMTNLCEPTAEASRPLVPCS